jgi:hypothetical protein
MNNILCDKLMKYFGMRYSTSYENPGLKTFAFGCFDFKVRPGPGNKFGSAQTVQPHPKSPQTLLQSFYLTIQCNCSACNVPGMLGYRKRQFSCTNPRSGRTSNPGHSRGTPRCYQLNHPLFLTHLILWNNEAVVHYT